MDGEVVDDSISTGTGAATGAAPGTIMGQALGGPIGVAAGGALGGVAEEALGNDVEEPAEREIVPQSSGYTRGYEEDAAQTRADQTRLNFLEGSGNRDYTDSDPMSGMPSDQKDTTTRPGD